MMTTSTSAIRAGAWAAIILLPAALSLAAAASADQTRTAPTSKSPGEWFAQGREAARRAAAEKPTGRRARNVILFVGDGMGLSTVTAARILEGQRLGGPGEDHELSFERLPNLAVAKVYSVNAQIPDSAPTMTAIVTGVKTARGMISVSADASPADPSPAGAHNLTSLLEIFEREGRSTGIITTARLTHATPAACYAHTPEREWESDADLSPAARGADYPDIARQLLEWGDRPGDGPEVAMGGGRAQFQPESEPDPEDSDRSGRRLDGRDLTVEWAERPGAAYVWNAEQLDAINPAQTKRLLALFERSHMEYESDRAQDTGGEPSLARMTERALQILKRNPKGYFLMVEAGRIDHAHHEGNAYRALEDTIALAAAVDKARRMTSPSDTLLVVTADHSHVFYMGGYPDRGNPILGLVREGGQVALDDTGKTYTTLGYANGPGAKNGERPDPRSDDTTAKGYKQQALIPLRSESHAGEDVLVYAGGPGAPFFHGAIEQNTIFHLIVEAARLKAYPPGLR